MILRIKAKDAMVSVEAQNIVYSRNSNQQTLEISCPNRDVYKFIYRLATAKNAKKFEDMCENLMTARDQDRDVFFCSLEEFENIKFEKHSLVSHIE